MPSFDFKKLRIDFLIVVAFAVISLLYCYPQLQGKKLRQSDNVSWQGASYEARTYHDSTGKDVLWSNSMFGGMPTYTLYIGAQSYNYPGYLQNVIQSLGKPAYFFFLAMLCFFILMRVLGVSEWLSAIGAFAYAFSSYNAIIIGVGHDTKMLTLGYLPAAMAGLFLLYRQKWWSGAALLGVAITLIFSNNHYQVIYYSLIMFACFGIGMLVIAIKEGTLKKYFISTVVAIVVSAVAIGCTASYLLSTLEYSKFTMRGGSSELSGHDSKPNGGLDKEYAFRWSNGIGETFCIMIPYLYGGSSDEPADEAPKTSELTGGNAEAFPLYWGDQPFLGGPVYFGAIICFLFVLGIFVVRSPHKWWLLAASAIFIVLSWGSNFAGFNYFLFDHLPYLNKFRTPSMALVIPQLIFPLLGIWGVQEIFNQKANTAKLWKDIKIAAGITAGLCLVLGLGGSMFFDFTSAADARYQPELVKALKEDRASLALMSGLKSAIYILIAAGLLWAFIKNKIKPVILIAGLGILIAIDLIPVAHSYLNERNYEEASDYQTAFEPREVDKEIMKDPDPYYRVLDLSRDTYNDAIQCVFHKCIGGYNPAKMERYQDLIDHFMSKGFNPQVLNMLNTKYIIVGGQKSPLRVQRNPEACGNAWFVDEVKWAKTYDDVIKSLNAPDIGDTTVMPDAFNPRKTAVIMATDNSKAKFGNYTFAKDSNAYVKLTKYGLDDLSYSSKNTKDGFAVFSDIYYSKGWNAYVDGKQTPIIRVDYVLRAIKLPAGAHNIEFHFRPQSFYTGRQIALVCSILLFAIIIISLYPLMKKEEKPAILKSEKSKVKS